MLAVDTLRRVSAALLRHSTLRHHCFDEVKDAQGQGHHNVKAVRGRHSTPNYWSSVVPINVCHSSASLLPVLTSRDDVIGVTSFGGAPERRNTSTSPPGRNYFGAAADAYSGGGGTVNVNGVCFSVYGTLPRNLVRRRAAAKLGQGQGQLEVGQRVLEDEARTLGRQRVPSPPERSNFVNQSFILSTEQNNDDESTLTRRRRVATPGEWKENKAAGAVSRTVKSPVETTVEGGKNDDESCCYSSLAGNEFRRGSAPFFKDDDNTIKRRTETPLQADNCAVKEQGAANTDVGSSSNVTFRQQDFDSGTVRRRRDGQLAEVKGQGQVKVDEDVTMAVGVDQEFDSGTVKRRQRCASSRPTDSLTTDLQPSR